MSGSVPGRLDSWKAIAAYLKRDVTTVQRWERREGMPVHRHQHDKRGSVYALASELDAWRQSRGGLFERPAPTENAGELPRPYWRRRPLVVMALVVLVLAAVPYYVLHRAGAPHGVGPKISSLAVLPLRNLSGDTAQDYLADGMTEALIGRLAQLRDLRVISHTSVLRFRDPSVSAPEIGRRLGVDALVEGSVAREANHIRVTVQLIRAASDEHFWSETYDREFKDALGLESELAQAIAMRVEVTVTGAERERLAAVRTVAPEVYENYLKGRFAYDRSRGKADYDRSVDSFERAIQLDPTFAPAYLGLSEAYSMLGTVAVGGTPGETRPKAIDAARKALELDPNLTDAHVLLANIEQEQWHWRDAEAEYRRALELSPNDASAHGGFALWLLCQGRTDEAISWVQSGQRLDPIAMPGWEVAWIFFQARRYEEAIGELRSVLAVQPDNVETLSTLGFVFAVTGQDREAVPLLEKVVAASQGSPAAVGVLIRAYARSGRRADALKLLDDLRRRQAVGYVPAASFVNAYLGLGDKEAAFRALEQAYLEQSNILQFLKVHPYFDPIRSDPRFVDLVRRVWSDPATTPP
ncbi:MAG TPA: tetratricopeptide repeat protein [Steroidobacteraceae bacterium]|nr:tetratricopeptide repeat protein [Steroidobacteraceae bacterium]